MLSGSVMAWGSAVVCVTTYVGYQAGSLKSQLLAERNYRDPETGLMTRKGFEHRAMKMMKKQAGPIVVMVDLDGLKKVNDEFGHTAGDAFILEQANRIKNWAEQKNGFAARFGGDEFVAIVRGSANPLDLKEELSRPIRWCDQAWYWTASVGAGVAEVAMDRQGRREELSRALKRADRQMYADKGGLARGRR